SSGQASHKIIDAAYVSHKSSLDTIVPSRYRRRDRILRVPAFLSALNPFEGVFTPRINQRIEQEENKDHPGGKAEEIQLVVSQRPGEQEYNFNIEYQEDQPVDVILHLELNPGVADGFYAAFVGRLLDRIGLA